MHSRVELTVARVAGVVGGPDGGSAASGETTERALSRFRAQPVQPVVALAPGLRLSVVVSLQLYHSAVPDGNGTGAGCSVGLTACDRKMIAVRAVKMIVVRAVKMIAVRAVTVCVCRCVGGGRKGVGIQAATSR